MEEDKKEQLVDLLVRRGGVLFACTLWLYALYGAYDFWLSDTGELSRLDRRIQPLIRDVAALNEQMSKSEEFIRKQQTVRKELDEMEAQIKAFQKRLPNEFSDTEIFQLIADEVDTINMISDELVPGKVLTYDFYEGKAYELRAKGTFLQFLVLLERLSQKDRVMDVHDIVLKPSSNEGGFQILEGSMNLEAFRYAEKPKVATPPPGAKPKPGGKGAPKVPAPKAVPKKQSRVLLRSFDDVV